jgi:rubrerythrin
MTGTVADLMDLLYEGEKLTERFYMALVEMFLHEPVAAGVWWDMAAEEALHCWLVEKAREALSPEQLAMPVDSEIMEAARRRASISLEKLWASIQTLEDAYQAAHQMEAEEFDAILGSIMEDFFPNDIRNHLARSQLSRHLRPLERLRTKEWRLMIHRR